MNSCRVCLKPCAANSLYKNRFFREKFQDILCMWLDPRRESSLVDVCKECETDVVEFYSFKHQCRDIIRGVEHPTPLIDDHEKISLPEDEHSSNALQSLLDNCAETVELSIETLESLNTDGKEGTGTAPKPKKAPKPRPKQSLGPSIKKRRFRFRTPEEILKEKMRPKRPIQRKTEAEKAMDPAEYKRYYFQKTMEKYKKTCEICGKRFPPDRLEGHMNGHRGLTPYKCGHCELQFNCKLNLRGHIQRMHVTGREVNCTLCGKQLSNEITLKKHMFAVHDEKKFQCTLCGLKILSKHSLQRHMNIHTQTRDYVCPHCGKAFYCQSVLTIHLRTHSGETPYTCNICPKNFIHRRIYVMHMQKLHPGEPLMQLNGAKALKETLMKKYHSGI
nr:zinc finger protein 709-like [Aedes albopictus]